MRRTDFTLPLIDTNISKNMAIINAGPTKFQIIFLKCIPHIPTGGISCFQDNILVNEKFIYTMPNHL